MKVTHFNSLDSGGAFHAAYRLHSGLNEFTDVKSNFFSCRDFEKRYYSNSRKTFFAKVLLKIDREFKAILENERRKRIYGNVYPKTFHSFNRSYYKFKHFEPFLNADIVNLHWIAGFIDYEKVLPTMTRRTAIVWTLHDVHPLSGIWHYRPDADELSPGLIDLDAKVFACKKRILDSIPASRMTIVGPSKWISDEALKSVLLNRFEIHTIPYGINLKEFFPISKKLAREALNIPEDFLVLGFVSHNLSDPRKGGHLLQESLSKSFGKKLLLLTVGSGNLEFSGGKQVHLGQLKSSSLLRLFYSALDLFACPSLQDNLPNTVIEALACGTPCIGFKVGGIPDMIRPEVSGWLVEEITSNALRAKLMKIFEDSTKLEIMGQQARALAVSEYSVELQAQRYESLYKTILEKSECP